MTAKKLAPLSSIIERNQLILSTGVDHARRRIYLYNAIEDGAALRVTAALALMEAEDAPVQIYMNTPGGCIEDGYAIYDAIKMNKNHITVVGFGAVMSMGAIIMQAADMRLMAPEARFMIHTGNITSEDGSFDTDKFIAYGQEMEAIRKRFIDILADRSGLSKGKVRTLLLKETYLSAEKSFELGFIDGVLQPEPKRETEDTKVRKPRTKRARS